MFWIAVRINKKGPKHFCAISLSLILCFISGIPPHARHMQAVLVLHRMIEWRRSRKTSLRSLGVSLICCSSVVCFDSQRTCQHKRRGGHPSCCPILLNCLQQIVTCPVLHFFFLITKQLAKDVTKNRYGEFFGEENEGKYKALLQWRSPDGLLGGVITDTLTDAYATTHTIG